MNFFVWKLSKIASEKKVFFLHFIHFFYLLRFSVFFNGLFAPTYRSGMSNIFRDSESLGKSNEKKWSNIWTFLFGSGLKSPRKKKKNFCWFCLGPPSYGIGATIRIGREMLCLPYAGFFFLNIREYKKHNIYTWLARSGRGQHTTSGPRPWTRQQSSRPHLWDMLSIYSNKKCLLVI